MKLSIVTINYNDAVGLKRTLDSVASQSFATSPSSHLAVSPLELEHIIIDGASTDGSVEVIRDYEKRLSLSLRLSLIWISEPDKGIYNAMNKGIEIACGVREVDSFNRSKRSEDKNKGGSIETEHYIQILNSGDILASNTVIQQMSDAIHRLIAQSPLSHLATSPSSDSAALPDLIYGNMIKKDYATGKIIGKSGEVPYSLLNYFTSTMNHDCCWMKRTSFVNDNHNDNQNQCYGLYDEELKIVSDWKWFLCAIALGINPSSHLAISPIRPIYVDIDMTIFDVSGISERNLELRNQERRQVLEELLPPAILADYNKHAFDMQQMDRLRKHHLYGLVYFIERVLFKLEKWGILK